MSIPILINGTRYNTKLPGGNVRSIGPVQLPISNLIQWVWYWQESVLSCNILNCSPTTMLYMQTANASPFGVRPGNGPPYKQGMYRALLYYTILYYIILYYAKIVMSNCVCFVLFYFLCVGSIVFATSYLCGDLTKTKLHKLALSYI